MRNSFFIFILFLLAGCQSSPGILLDSTRLLPTATATNVPLGTQIVQAIVLPTLTLSTETPTALLTATTAPISEKTPDIQVQPTRKAGCNLAAAGRPIDVSIPDNTRIHPEDTFLKTWRLINVGSCTWTKEYSVVWFSGEYLAFRKEEPFHEIVLPGQSVDLSINMVAPQKAGLYQSNWKLRDENGELFGIGPAAASPFWVRFEVVSPDVVGLPPLSTWTPIPRVQSSGSALLFIGQPYDLDGATQGPSAGDDVFLRLTNDRIEIVPQNGSRLAAVGSVAPSVADCIELAVQSSPIVLGSEAQNTYLCMKTDKGQPASLYVARVDAPKNSVDIHFTVWAQP